MTVLPSEHRGSNATSVAVDHQQKTSFREKAAQFAKGSMEKVGRVFSSFGCISRLMNGGPLETGLRNDTKRARANGADKPLSQALNNALSRSDRSQMASDTKAHSLKALPPVGDGAEPRLHRQLSFYGDLERASQNSDTALSGKSGAVPTSGAQEVTAVASENAQEDFLPNSAHQNTVAKRGPGSGVETQKPVVAHATGKTQEEKTLGPVKIGQQGYFPQSTEEEIASFKKIGEIAQLERLKILFKHAMSVGGFPIAKILKKHDGVTTRVIAEIVLSKYPKLGSTYSPHEDPNRFELLHEVAVAVGDSDAEAALLLRAAHAVATSKQGRLTSLEDCGLSHDFLLLTKQRLDFINSQSPSIEIGPVTWLAAIAETIQDMLDVFQELDKFEKRLIPGRG